MSKKQTCPNCNGKKGWWTEHDGKREWIECDWCLNESDDTMEEPRKKE